MWLNLLRYTTWQLRDFARERGIALILIGLAIGTTILGPMKAMRIPFSDDSARQILATIISQVAFIAAFVALNGIVSNDRKLGYYRFLFSKSVRVPAYYAQQFVMFFIGFVVVFAMLIGLFALLVHPVAPRGPLIYSALVFLSLGGVAFLISSLFRFDWPILVGVFLVTNILHSVIDNQEGLAGLLLRLLPPFQELPGMAAAINAGTVDSSRVIWLLGYSAICFIAGLIVLRRRPFG